MQNTSVHRPHHRLRWRFVIAALVALAASLSGELAHAAGSSPDLEEDKSFEYDHLLNPANLKMFAYVPAKVKDGTESVPLVVLLHGCGQTAADYFRPTGWKKLADEMGFVLLLPEQPKMVLGLTGLPKGSPATCFTWWEPDRGNKETRSIMNMVRRLIDRTDVKLDPSRIFVTGLSAGAGMTVDLAALYPTCFAGAAPIAGLPYYCAQGPAKAVSECMLAKTPPRWPPDDDHWSKRLERACRGDCPKDPGSWPRMSLWQGAGDQIVSPRNLDILMHQWTSVHDADESAKPELLERGDYLIEHKKFLDGNKRVVVETWLISGKGKRAGHVVPIDSDHGCGTPQDFVADENICSSREIAKFFKLDEQPRKSAMAGHVCKALE